MKGMILHYKIGETLTADVIRFTTTVRVNGYRTGDVKSSHSIDLDILREVKN